MNNKPIGVFDSGLGGLTAVKEIMRVLPFEDIIISKHYTSGNYKRWEDTIVIDDIKIKVLYPNKDTCDRNENNLSMLDSAISLCYNNIIKGKTKEEIINFVNKIKEWHINSKHTNLKNVLSYKYIYHIKLLYTLFYYLYIILILFKTPLNKLK